MLSVPLSHLTAFHAVPVHRKLVVHGLALAFKCADVIESLAICTVFVCDVEPVVAMSIVPSAPTAPVPICKIALEFESTFETAFAQPITT